ncbi:MAG: DoxX family protein [Acidimicrobiales bacterium]
MRYPTDALDASRPAALLVIRVVVGGLFVYHGIDKFDAGISMVEGMFRSWGVPAPGLAAPLVAVLEIVGGLALLAGLAARAAGAVLALVMIGALLYVKVDLGVISSTPMPGAELDLAYLAGLVATLAFGPGRWSADAVLGLEQTAAPAQPAPGEGAVRSGAF